MMMRNLRSFVVRSAIVSIMAAATGCGGYGADDGAMDPDAQLQLDRARKRMRPLSSTGSDFDKAPSLQAQAAAGGVSNLVSSDKLSPFDGVTEDAFGAAVAIDGTTLAVGAPDRDDVGGNSGAVYIYVIDSGVWTLQEKLTAKDGTVDDNFGFSLALSGDRLVVGARRAAGIANTQSGAAYVYERSGKSWTLTAKISPNDGGFENFFGYAVALLQDDPQYPDTIFVGAPQADVGGLKTGATYAYTFDGAKWTLAKKFSPPGGGQDDYFGATLAVIPSSIVFGPSLLIGSWNDNSAPGPYDGAVYVYSDPWNLQPWGLQTKLVASDQDRDDTFGFSIATYGTKAFIGAPYRTEDCPNSGTVYVFGRHSGEWCEEQIIVPDDKHAGQLFGYSVGIFGDAAVIGAAYDDDKGDYSGSAYVYTYGKEGWGENFKFVPDDGEPLGLVGYSAAMDGDKILVGALGDTNTINGTDTNAGAAYIFSALDDPNAPQQLLLSKAGAQCSVSRGVSTTPSGWFIGLGLAAYGMRRWSRKTAKR